MRFILIFTLVVILAGCAMRSPSPQKLVVQAAQTEALVAYVTRTRHISIEARAGNFSTNESDRWLLLVTTERQDGRAPEVTAAYAFGALIPYIRTGSVGAREEGYIPMSRDAFKALSQTGMKIELLDGESRLHAANVPAVVFARAIGR